jgi:hypothetical protein
MMAQDGGRTSLTVLVIGGTDHERAGLLLPGLPPNVLIIDNIMRVNVVYYLQCT